MFRLKTLGGLCLEGAAGVAAGRGAQRRRLALLAALADTGGAPVSRDKLVARFWPERDTAGARHALAQAVYDIRRTLGDAAVLGGPADDLRLNPEVVASDVDEFLRALAQGDLERAVAYYTGPFLDGVYVNRAPEFERWAETERDRLARAYAGALGDLARDAASEGDARRAFEWWSRLAAVSPLDARVTEAAMRAAAAAGDRASAFRFAARHGTAWREELGSAPDSAVTALVQELRRAQRARTDESAPPVAAMAPARVPSIPTGTPPAVDPRARWRIRPPAAVVVGVVVLLGGLLAAGQLRPTSFPEREIVLGTIASSDPALGLAVREALRAELDGTRGLRVTTEPAVDEQLRLMHFPLDSAVQGSVAIELAQRRGAAFAVVGSAMPLGTGVSVVIRVLDATSGSPVATVTAQPARPRDVIGDVVRLAREVRSRVTGMRGEPGEPLPRVTTTSLAALKAYALARRALGRGDRLHALELAEAALVHDSTFALAHYFLGDQLWFTDRERASEEHLRKAFELSDGLPPRERLIVRARYQQLVLDEPDSAAETWERLRAAFPGEVHALEGLAWTYRALGRFSEAAEVSAEALASGHETRSPNATSRFYALLAAGDTAAARAFAEGAATAVPWALPDVRWFTALVRGDSGNALRVLEAAYPLSGAGAVPPNGAVRWQITYLVLGRLTDAERAMSIAVAAQRAQEPPRALLCQARAEIALGGSPEHAAALAREALAWVKGADLSAPAYARLIERIADVAVRAADTATLDSAAGFLDRLDGGRGLRSYGMARAALAAYRAFGRGRYARAAQLAARARGETYFWRATSPLVLLEADALAATGDTAGARARYRSLLHWPVPGDADYETWLLVRAIVQRNDASSASAKRDGALRAERAISVAPTGGSPAWDHSREPVLGGPGTGVTVRRLMSASTSSISRGALVIHSSPVSVTM